MNVIRNIQASISKILGIIQGGPKVLGTFEAPYTSLTMNGSKTKVVPF